MKKSAVFMIGLAICVAFIFLAGERAFAGDPLHVFTATEEAFKASRHGLTSGTASGSFERSTRDSAGQWTVDTKASVNVQFKGDKFFIELVYEIERLGSTTRRIVYDGSVLAAIRLSPKISLGGATDVFQRQPGTNGVMQPSAAEFPWDVSKLSANLLDVTGFLKAQREQSLVATETPEGDYVIERSFGNGQSVRYTFAKDVGFNLQNMYVAKENEEPLIDATLKWTRKNELWVPVGLTRFARYLDDPPTVIRQVLAYHEFLPNAEVADDMFTLSALQMPGGSRIVDRSAREVAFYHQPMADEEVAEKLNGIVAELKNMSPGKSNPVDELRPHQVTNRIAVVLAANVLFLVLIFAGVWISKRKHRTTG